MRNFRNAAVASAAAVALTMGGASVASAAEINDQFAPLTTSEGKGAIFAGKQENDGTWPNSANKGDADKYYATNHFGEQSDPATVPDWARWWVDGILVAGIGAVVGLIIAGFNWLSYNGLVKF